MKPSSLTGLTILGGPNESATTSALARPRSPVHIRATGPTIPLETLVNCTLSLCFPTYPTCGSGAPAVVPGTPRNTVGHDSLNPRVPLDPGNTTTAHRNTFTSHTGPCHATKVMKNHRELENFAPNLLATGTEMEHRDRENKNRSNTKRSRSQTYGSPHRTTPYHPAEIGKANFRGIALFPSRTRKLLLNRPPVTPPRTLHRFRILLMALPNTRVTCRIHPWIGARLQ